MAQLLTPAPSAREVEWKRAVFKRGDHEYTDIKPERIERAIAEDVEFSANAPDPPIDAGFEIKAQERARS